MVSEHEELVRQNPEGEEIVGHAPFVGLE